MNKMGRKGRGDGEEKGGAEERNNNGEEKWTLLLAFGPKGLRN
jgi:hypothetical protein